MESLYLLKSSISTSHILTLVFTSMFLVSLGMISHNAFAMGSQPSTCSNRYDGPIVSFIINNGSKTFDAIANPGLTFDENSASRYTVTFVIHTLSTNSQGNADSGTSWYASNWPGYVLGECVNGAGPNQNVTIGDSWSIAATTQPGTTQSVQVSTDTTGNNPVTFNVHWIANSSSTSTVPSAPQNLQSDAGNSQVSLSWTSPSSNGGSPITNYNVYMSTNSGTETLLATIGNVTSYNDTSATNGQTYFYKVTAVNSVGESPQSNEVKATPITPSTSGSGTNPVIATIPVNGTLRIAANPNTHMVYVATGHLQVQVINDSSNTVVATIPTHSATPCSDSTQYVAANPKTNLVYASTSGCMYPGQYVPSFYDPTFLVINGTTNTVISTMNFGAVQEPIQVPIAVNPQTNIVYVDDGSQLYAINGTTNQIISTVSAGGADLSVNQQTNTIYVHSINMIYVVDGKTNSVVKSLTWGKTSYYDIGLDTATNMIYVANNDDTVSVIDGSTYQVVAMINGTSYGLIGVNPITDKIFVSSPGPSRYLSVIDGATNSLQALIQVGQNSYGVGINTATNRIYVSNAGDKTVSVIDGNALTSAPTQSPPSAPQNLQAMPTSFSQIKLSWNAPTSNGTSSITGYQIYRSTDDGNTWSTIGSTPANTTTFSNMWLIPTTTYTYRVTAANWYPVPGPYSNIASATSPSGGFIGLDNLKSVSGSTTTSSPYQFTLPNFNVGTGTNRLLLVGIDAFAGHYSDYPVVTSVAFNGVPLTQSQPTAPYGQSPAEGFWYLKNPTGTGNLTVTTTESLPIIVGAYALHGVDLANPIPSAYANWSPIQTITTQYPNDWVVDLVSDYWDPYPISNPTCTQQWNLVSSYPAASSAASSASPGTMTCSWTSNPGSHNWGTEIIEIKAANSTTVISTHPYPPQNLQGSSANLQVTLSWLPPSNNGSSPITNYNVYRGFESGTESLLAKIGNVTSYNDSSVASNNGGTYFYKVTSLNSVGESSASNEISIVVSSASPPSAPTGLSATVVSPSQIDLTWVAPSNDGGSAITGYQVSRSTDGGNTWYAIVSNTNTTSTSYSDIGLGAGMTYAYRVAAINSGGLSLPSNTSTATTTSESSGGSSDITLNNVQSTSGTTSSSNQVTLSNFNVGSSTDQLLVVGISANNNNAVSVTFNGTPLTKAVSSFYNNDAEFWYLKNPSGTGNIVATFGGQTQAVVGAYSLANVNQSSPMPTHVAKHNTSASSPSISITTKYPNDVTLDLPSIYGNEKLSSPTCTNEWNVNVPSSITGASSSQTVPSPATVTCSWTTSNPDLYDDIAVEVQADSTSSTSGTSSSSTTVPSAPQNLQATTASSSQINLSWNTPSSNGGSPITNYNVYRGTSSGTETLLTKIGNVTSFNDTTVINGQTYFYKISTVNSMGESTQSNEVNVAPTTPATIPSAPTGLTASTVSSSQINLSWTSPNNGGSAITGYEIERSNNNGSTWSTAQSNTGSTDTTYSDTGLSPSTAYTYRVSAINSAGTSSPSNTASATTNAIVPNGIILNNMQSTSGTASNDMTISSFNTGTGSNNLLLVGISANNNDVASVTFGGTPLKNMAYSFYNNDAEFWYLKNPSGTGDVIVTMNGPTQAVVGAYSFSGVNQTVPIPTHVTKHNTSANSPKISITTKYANDWVLDLPSIYSGSTLGKSTCTQQWDTDVPNAITGASSSVMVPTPGAVTCGWTASSGDMWDDAAVEINAANR